MKKQTFVRTLLAVGLVAPFLAGALPRLLAQTGRIEPSLYSALRWRSIGPFRGGRVNGVSGVPGQPNVFYMGSVGGGVWKTTNAGRTWQPIFDSQPIASIGAIGVAPSAPDTVYVGTGEADMRSQISFGNGMYKSTDAGRTWTHIGLEATRQIGKVIVDPRDPNVVFVAALGHVYGANPDRGVFRTRDGGATWQKVLFKNNDVGAIDLAFDPTSSQIIYAALWNTKRPPWSIYPPSYGPGSGLYKSTDGGANWQQLTNGLPTDGLGRIGVAVAPSNRNRVYAIVDAKDGGMYRSDDAGATFRKVSGDDNRIWGRGWYFGKIVVDPKNADLVYSSNTGVYRSRDGGRTWGEPFKGSPGGDDYHQLWIYPDDGNRMILGGDQGAVISVDGLNDHPTWSSWLNQATAQIYRIAVDNAFPYWVTGAQQDSGAVRVRSRGKFAGITMRDWEPACAGGESGYTAPDPLNPDILYGGTVTKCNVQTNQTENVSPEVDLPTPPRHTWTLPVVFSPVDQHALYFSDQYLFKTTDGGKTWARISEDMTRENPGVPSNLDAAAAADAPEGGRRGVIYSIAPSAVRAPLIWIGTDDGYIHVTQDDGKTWTNVTPREVTAWSKVVMLEASHFDANEAYAAIDRHRLTDNEPYIFRTKDGGKTWQKITNGLPAGVYVQTIREDPKRRGFLVAGTELALFSSFDDGDSWQSLQLNLPPTSMRDLQFHDNDLVLGTHGRGIWILDDISVLRQIGGGRVSASGQPETRPPDDVILYKPSDAIILPASTDDGTPTQKDEPEAENPPAGAVIDYYLRTAQAGPVTLEILNASGAVVRHYSSADPAPAVNVNTLAVNAVWQRPPEPLSAAAGLHRFVWDFRPDPPAGGGRGRGGRGGGGGGGGRGGPPPVAAANYTVRLTVNGKAMTQPLVVKPDPRLK
ncbi:MAG: hypothetical protein LAO77_21380 [Acidobacteriia bacterium]|nr:hypothetical protein [Terriglobia bacterium]